MYASDSSRRGFLRRIAAGGAAFAAPAFLGDALFTRPGLFAEELRITPTDAEGPFYPDKLPLDTDNDLLILNDAATPALGEVTYLSGRVLTPSGSPIRNAVVEIWQCDQTGVYLHSRSGGDKEKRDANFQGFGRFLTDSKGRYFFRTIKPVEYVGRTPHIHVIVKQGTKRLLTTQLYVKGCPTNEKDGLYQRIPKDARDLITLDFKPIKESKLGELEAEADLVIGRSPEDPKE